MRCSISAMVACTDLSLGDVIGADELSALADAYRESIQAETA